MFSSLIAACIAFQSPGWAAEACSSGQPPEEAIGNVQFFADRDELLAWREWRSGDQTCVHLDWPEPRRLTAAGAIELADRLAVAEQRRRALVVPALPRAEVERARRPERPAWLPFEMVPAPVTQGPLPLCPRVPARDRMLPVEVPTALAATVLRVRPHRCAPGTLPAAGSGILLSPLLGLTAAHVVMTPAGQVCSRYRVAPGGRRYSDPPAAPYGLSFVSRAELSGRGGWSEDAGSAPPRTGDLDARTRHDHAWLLLDDAARLPADAAWPRVQFGVAAAPTGEPVLSAGYPAQTPTARSAPGAMVSLWGQAGCTHEHEVSRRHALWLSLGSSGGPIWNWSAGRPLHLHSLAARVEGLPGERFETVGPYFDRVDYQRLLELLARERAWRASVPPKAPVLRWAPLPEGATSRRQSCGGYSESMSLMGPSGLSACRARCAARPKSCQ
ncbi:MAG: trypsin-like peptidase domain-containing protein [Rhodanobacteraceae bacterium]|nr:trypsin-like peptidase domain-containing protein [Rhodanobacteraceae bacterium]